MELETSTPTKDLTYAYDAINRLETITDNLGGGEDVAYLYDANGNTLSKTKAGVTTEFKYDIRNQLSEVLQGPSTLGRYGYDYEGMRILKIGDAGRTHYTYDQLSVITEANISNVTVSKYDYGLDQLVSLENTTEGRSFFHLDFLGSTVNLTDGVGGTRQSVLYDAWGNERDRVGVSANNFTFTGHELDEETGLIYAKARFYDPDIGRFITQDSYLGDASNAPSLHRYFYANQNPLFYFDPTGRSSQSLGEIAKKEKERRAENGTDAQAFSDEGTGPVTPRPQSSSTTTFEETQAAVDQLRKGSTNEFDFRDPSDPAERERREALERAVAAVRSGAPGATIIREQVDLELQVVDAYDDPQLTGVIFAKRKLQRGFRTASGAAVFAGEMYIVIAAGTANDVKIVTTGTDLTGHEANRWIALGAIVVVGVTSSQFTALNRVDDELRAASQGKKGTSGAATSGGGTAARADDVAPAATRQPITDPNRLLAPPRRPTARQSELDQAAEYGWPAQQSYSQGRPTRYGEPGSVRPDISHPNGLLHLDVKNYDLSSASNRANLYNDIRRQAQARAANLPAGSHQGIVIDIRGQSVEPAILQRIPSNIEKATGGIIPSGSVVFRSQ